jgi:hypothetical protein
MIGIAAHDGCGPVSDSIRRPATLVSGRRNVTIAAIPIDLQGHRGAEPWRAAIAIDLQGSGPEAPAIRRSPHDE